jgi:hypothetical protein
MTLPKVQNFRDQYKIDIPTQRTKDWEQWVLLISDEHFDSIHCDRQLLKRHHDQAKERNAIILKFGDMFDCMGGKYDPRSTKEHIRPELQKKDYFDALIQEAVKFYGPYKDNIAFTCMGNHEYSVLKRHETNLVTRFAREMDCISGKYRGFIRLHFTCDNGKSVGSFDMYYVHGSGGSSPVTRGVIKSNRRQEMAIADFYVSAHTHNEFHLTRPLAYMTNQGVVKIKEPVHISLGCYMNTFMKGSWGDGREFAPESMGGAWIRFYYSQHIISGVNTFKYQDHSIKADVMRAT